MDTKLKVLIQKLLNDEVTRTDIENLLINDSYYDGYDLSIFLSQLKTSNSSLKSEPQIIYKIQKKITEFLDRKPYSSKYSKASFEEEGYAEFKKVKMPYASIY